jgi:hypothetical protein
MSEEIKINRPQQPMYRPEASPMPMNEPMVEKKSSSKPWIVLGVVVVLLVIAAVLFRDKLTGGKAGEVKGITNSSQKYQAVFLTNGQVYFGKIEKIDSEWLTVKEIYYLQVLQPPLQGQAQPDQAGQQAQPQISLVKLGNELHGPEDMMNIAKSQVLFWEDLKNDGQVAKAISDYKANPAK